MSNPNCKYGRSDCMPCTNCDAYIPTKTNADHIRSMTDEELAKHNVRESTEYVFDYDWDENPVGEYVSCWRTSDEAIFWNYDLAIEYELNWLKQPYSGGDA